MRKQFKAPCADGCDRLRDGTESALMTPEELEERKRLYREGCTPTERELRAQAVAACTICDAHGYRGGFVCDHVDRTEIYRRGRALVEQALAEAKTQRAHGDDTVSST